MMDDEQQEWNERNIRTAPKYRGLVLTALFGVLFVAFIMH